MTTTTHIATLVGLDELPKFMNATQKLIQVGATLAAFETVTADADADADARAARDALMVIAKILNVAGSADLAPGAVAQREALITRMRERATAQPIGTPIATVGGPDGALAAATSVDVGTEGGLFSVGHETLGPLRVNLPSLAACEAVLAKVAAVDPAGFDDGKYWIDDGHEGTSGNTDWSVLVDMDPIEKS